MRRIYVLLALLLITLVAGFVDFSKNPRVIINHISSVNGDVGEKDTLKAFTIVPREKNDWVWWTSNHPEVVSVWPVGLKFGTFPDEESPALIAAAEVEFVYPGQAEICAELHRRPSRDEVRQIMRPYVYHALRDTSYMALATRVLAALKRAEIVSKKCVIVISRAKTPPDKKKSVQIRIASL